MRGTSALSENCRNQKLHVLRLRPHYVAKQLSVPSLCGVAKMQQQQQQQAGHKQALERTHVLGSMQTEANAVAEW